MKLKIIKKDIYEYWWVRNGLNSIEEKTKEAK
jgi:hypothetical protein